MKPSEIIAQARVQTATDTNNYTNAQAIIDLNFIYADICSDIISQIDEDYFFDIGTGDLVANQNEYNIESLSTVKINEINKVFVKYASTDTYFTKVRRENPLNLDKGNDWYQANQLTTDPFYFIQDRSIFLFPTPSSNVTSGIEIHSIYQPADLSLSTDTEASILIAPRFHKVFVDGLKYLIFGGRKLLQEENTYYQRYLDSKNKMITQMKNRNQDVIYKTLPDLTNYC